MSPGGCRPGSVTCKQISIVEAALIWNVCDNGRSQSSQLANQSASVECFFYVLSVVCIGPIKILTALTILTEHGNGKLHNLLSKGNYLWFYEAVLQGASGTIHEPKHYPES